MHGKVKHYLETLPSPQKQMCMRVRDIILKTFPDIEESFKNGVPWYECKYYIAAFKDHVNIGFSVEGMTQQDRKRFEGNGKYMQHIKLCAPDDIDEAKIVELLKLVK